jgi:hypothetical protein
MTETCADCGKPIAMHEGSYYRKDPADDIGRTFHSTCGDPLGIKAKDAEIDRLDRAACALARENEQLQGLVSQGIAGEHKALIEIEQLRAELNQVRKTLNDREEEIRRLRLQAYRLSLDGKQ